VPALNIRLRGADGRLQPETPAIIDSGADVSTFPGEWAKSLGITLDLTCCEEKTARTASGTTTVWCYPQGIHVSIEGVEHFLKADFCHELEVPLLGRRDFFSKYKVCFDERKKVFTLEAYSEPAI
jgi:hypothetical protein